MGDAGEALIDAEDRAQEFLAEREQARARRGRGNRVDPQIERDRQRLELGLADLKAQLEKTTHPRRREQLATAIADVEKRLAGLVVAAPTAE